VSNDQLWGAGLLALGALTALTLYQTLDSGRWTFWLWRGRPDPVDGVPIPRIDRRFHPIAFWLCVTWEASALMMLTGLGVFELLTG
jgi:hypothetical protein